MAELTLLKGSGGLQDPRARPVPLESPAAVWRGRQDAGDEGEQARGNVTAIKGPGMLYPLPTMLPGLDPRAKLLGKHD